MTFKGSWGDTTDGPKRIVRSYDLRDLEFFYDEVHSGLRTPSEASLEVQGFPGQSDRFTLTHDVHLGGVVSVSLAPKPGGSGGSLWLVKLTGGSLWTVSGSCPPSVGDEFLLTEGEGGKYGLYSLPNCDPDPVFVGSW